MLRFVFVFGMSALLDIMFALCWCWLCRVRGPSWCFDVCVCVCFCFSICSLLGRRGICLRWLRVRTFAVVVFVS